MGLTADAVAVAGALVRLAGEFDREAHGWSDYPRVAARCRDAVDTMTDAARRVLRSGDTDWGEAWITSGRVVLAHLSMARLFRDGDQWQLDPLAMDHS